MSANFYVIYSPTTGAIVRSGSCSDPKAVELQARAGEAALAVAELITDRTHVIDVTQTPHAPKAKP